MRDFVKDPINQRVLFAYCLELLRFNIYRAPTYIVTDNAQNSGSWLRPCARIVDFFNSLRGPYGPRLSQATFVRIPS